MFVLKDDKTLVEMKPAHFAAESDFQQLLSDYPDLLAGARIDGESPRRWILVKREAPIPSEEGGSGRWFVDHLFLDQDGIPTFVEVKRQSDTRIRREVIGQMLDYAANSVVNLRVGEIKTSFEENCARGVDPLEIIAKLLGQETRNAELDDTNTEDFWARVKTNYKLEK